MKCALVSLYDENFKEIGDFSWYNNKVHYAKRHNYDAIVKTDNFDPKIGLGFEKIKLLLDVMNKGDHDIIHWSGADTLITNFFIPITEFVYPNYHITMAKDFSGGMNSDSIVLRNSPEVRSWLTMIMDHIDMYRWDHRYEQGVMWDTFGQWSHIIKIVPQRFLNSYHYPLYVTKGAKNTLDGSGYSGQWYPGDFLFHACDQTNDVRLELFNQVNKLIVK